MKKWIIGAIMSLTFGVAYACVTTVVNTPDGRTVICTTCCIGGTQNCTTTCF